MIPMAGLGKILMLFGVMVFLLGVAVMVGGRLGLGHLPGDMSWRRGNTSVSFPIVSSIVASIVLTLVLNVILRLFR